MKHFILLFFFFSLVLGWQVTAQLASPVELTGSVIEPTNTEAGDIDMDGDIDIVTNSSTSGEILWMENLGQGDFAKAKVLFSVRLGKVKLKLVDLDADGDQDLLLASRNETLFWYENDGQGTFGNYTVLMDEAEILGSLYVADADFDGDLDIFEMDKSTDEIGVLYNFGNGDFSPFNPLLSNLEYAYSIYDIKAADFNGDGFIDLLVHNTNPLAEHNNSWFEGPVFYTEHEFEDLSTYSWSSRMLVHDFDGDNDWDLLVGFQYGHFQIYENLGDGTFDMHYQDSSNSWFANGVLADLDEDGDKDLIFSDNESVSNPRMVIWCENLGDFEFGDAEIISGSLASPDVESMCVADLNGNGLNCIVTAASVENEISWFENFGEGSFSAKNVLSESHERMQCLSFSKVDDDGAVDIIGAYHIGFNFFEIYYRRNLGYGNFSDKIQLLDSVYFTPSQVKLVDMDADGDRDLVASSNYGAVLYLNLGDFNFGPPIEASDGGYSHRIIAEDLDQDEDQDFIVFNYSDAELVWFQFSQPDVFTEILIDDDPFYYNQLFAEDIDGDGDLDILAIPNSTLPISWYENLGSSTFSARQDVPGIGEGARTVSIHHQNDGGVGLLVEKYGFSDTPGLFLYQNDGSGNFSPKLVTADMSDDITFMLAVDVNETGYPNVLFFEELYNNANYPDFYMDQLSVSSSEEYTQDDYIFSTIGLQSFFKAFDIDADGDEDLFIASEDDERILFIENSLYTPFSVSGMVYADLNQNGIKDSADVGLEGVTISSNPSTGYSLSSNAGNYSVFFNPTIEAEYVLTPQSLPGWSLTSDSAQFHVSIDSTFTWVDSLDFGFYPDSVYTNVEMDVTAGIFRCNNSTPIWVSLSNMGTSLPSGVIELELDPTITFLSAMTEPDSLVSNHVYWTMDSLLYSESQSIYLEVEMPPFTSIGDLLTIVTSFQEFDAFGEPSYFVSDSLQETLICAYDPNDKAVFPVGIDSAHYVAKDQELEYLIRFQNTGNDTAFTVIIEDQLPAELNLETFSVEASSHSMEAMIDYDGIASFTFENILLPDSNVDFLGSQGFVKFTIEPVDDLLPNTTISNMASIYFDLNPPIFTNTVFNTVECYIAPEPFIEFDFPVLRATVPEAVSYQWFLDGVIIEGAVADTLLPEFNGEYSVIVSDENDCSTFSSGYDFEVLSTTKDRKIEAHVYPNPFSEYATIKFGENLQGRYDLVICNTLGAQVQSVNDTDGSEILISRNDLGSGIFLAFLIEKATGEKLFIEKLVIQ